MKIKLNNIILTVSALVLTLNVLVTTRKRVTKNKIVLIILKWVAPVVCLIICN